MPIIKTNQKKDGQTKYHVRINYRDSSGQYKQLTRVAYGLSEAKELERHLQHEMDKGNTPEKSLTLERLFEEYVNVKQYEVRQSSLDKTKSRLKSYVLPYLGSTKITKLHSPSLTKWKTEIEQRGLSLTTRQNIYGELRALLNYAVRMEYLHTNPLLRVGNFKDAYQNKKEMLFYTPEEFKRYITEAQKTAEMRGFYDYYVFFCIAFFTGCRKGEIHALRWTDIKGDILSITKSITQKLKGQSDVETPPKNQSSNRTLQLPKQLMNILSEHKARCASTYADFSESYHICGGHRPLRDTAIANENIKYASLAELHQIRIHDFRHSHASFLVNNNVNILEIARRLGHSKIEQTLNTYAHFYPREEEKAVELLDSLSIV